MTRRIASRFAAAVAIAAGLSACETGGALSPQAAAPVAASIPPAEPQSDPSAIRPETFTLSSSDGETLAADVWRAEGAPRAILLGVHGFADYGRSTFEGPAPAWAAAGIEVVAYDQRGFGRNRSRGAWPGVEALIADFAAVAEEVGAGRPGVPLVALGHSMGGGVVLAAVGEGRAPAVEALILAAPAVAGGEHVGLLPRAAAWTAATLAPDTRWTGEGLIRIRASDNLEALRRLRDDPLYLEGASAREIMGLIRLLDRAAAAAAGAGVPVLHLHGARDELTPLAETAETVAAIPGPPRSIVYPDGWHLLLRDLQRARVWGDVRDFVLAQAEPRTLAEAR